MLQTYVTVDGKICKKSSAIKFKFRNIGIPENLKPEPELKGYTCGSIT